MTRLRFAVMWVAIVGIGLACAGRPRTSGMPRVDRETLTEADLNQRSFHTANDAIEALRPLWLTRRTEGGVVQVYLDDNRLGGPEVLRTVRILSVRLIKHMDGIQATARYGRGHEEGAILITTLATGR